MALSTSQIGVCSWSLHPKSTQELITELKKVGLSTIQLHLTPLLNDEAWKDTPAQLADAGITVASGMFGSKGENYTTLDTIRQTGGFILDEYWGENWANIQKLVKLAAAMKLDKVSTHAGFIPHEKSDPTYGKLSSRLKQIADAFNEQGIQLLFETGQETADALWSFLEDLHSRGTSNIRVNFDPANMILYDKGDPIASLKKLYPRVAQVHIKDATKTLTPGQWGKEVAAGQGEVDWPSFVNVLKQNNFQGGLIIEREAGATRIQDVKAAVALLQKLI